MKMLNKIFLVVIIAMCCLNVSAQWTSNTFVFGSLNRAYMRYVPPGYNPANPASLVFTLHGLGDNMANFSTLGFNYIADTANIIVICPQAVEDPLVSAIFGNGTAWNSGAGVNYLGNWYFPNASVNDIGFINALADTVRAHYSIDPSRIYVCGFSMGGFMTQRMALQSNTAFAAFASMSGTIGSGITSNNPGRAVPIAHFHGTADSTVFYIGNEYGIDPDSLINFWVLNNGCNPVPDSVRFMDAAADNITVDKFTYNGAGNDAEVLFYRMNGAEHTVLYQPGNDMTEILEVWSFFRRHHNLTAQVPEQQIEKGIQVYPNPAADFINIILPRTSEKIKVEIFTIQGALVYTGQIQDSFHHIPLNSNKIHNGMYLLRVSGVSVNFTQQIMIQK
ncbi:MAG TPA: T9SS type A sorting domain-containing protein [Bacteroidales bacterium]|mgnify:CR=1 FL=1|nr:T9SS type A sorting domain-containing protein [Bacteroidales bacterium]